MKNLCDEAHAGLPTWFRARCAEASFGGRDSYRHVGRQMMRTMLSGGEAPFGLAETEFSTWLNGLRRLLTGASPAKDLTKDESFEVWRRFRTLFPRFAAQVPSRRRAAFVTGMREMSEQEV